MDLAGAVLSKLADRLTAIANSQTGSRPERLFEPVCTDCADLGWIVEPGRGARACSCRERKRTAERLAALNRRYARFAEFDLYGLRPRADLHSKQAALIPAVQADPGRSWLMFGGTGSGKTLIGYCLAKLAIEQGRPVVAVTLAELLEQYRAQARGAEQLPVVDGEALREGKGRYLIFIDEIDKARPTEFAAEKFFQLANAIYDTGQQVVIASNLDKGALVGHWERASGGESGDGSQYGAPILRRLAEVENCAEVNLF